MKREIEVTEDGSHTLFVPELDEHYHSTHGAIRESEWVYIDAGLKYRGKFPANILEVGFGTGLNAFLSMLEADRREAPVFYTAMEMYPLSLSEAELLNYAALTDPAKQELFIKLHQSPWNKACGITPNFTLRKIRADAAHPANYPSDCFYDLVFFDAFAPDKQSQMWTPELFEKLYDLSADGGIITTYCAKGRVRRMFQSAGFVVERLPGPPGKREILRGRKG
ncbi:MAG: tRNA (5-methylaminomethyl-2-thiouridine)(34)-methyltransferase MnmD [Dysgonamonadaceae bacterium]|nr:tRNA (5-methylaminomethyl-2-thiouridine)(34)-methyltransferase MnmD [Dysgonamonadaceae bacterium]